MLIFHISTLSCQYEFFDFTLFPLELFEFKGAGIQLIVLAFLGNQFIVAAAFDDTAVLENHDGIGVLDRGETVGDDEHRPAVHQRVHAPLDNGLGTGIDGGGGLIEDHDRRISHGGPGDAQQLPLALAQVGAVTVEYGVVALGQTADEVVSTGQLGRCDTLFVAGFQIAVADIFHNGAREEVRVLKHHTQRVPQVGFLDLVDVDAIVADFAVVDVVEPVDEVGDGGLTGTGGAHKGNLLTGLGEEGDVVEDDFVRRIAEVHIEEPHVAGQFGVGDGTVVVGMFPGPDHGALGALGQSAVGVLLGVDQGHVAIVGFGLLVQQGEDPVGTGPDP